MINMITLIKTIMGLSILMIVWMFVQYAWKKIIIGPEYLEEDALKERGTCSGCSCINECVNKL